MQEVQRQLDFPIDTISDERLRELHSTDELSPRPVFRGPRKLNKAEKKANKKAKTKEKLEAQVI